ncbi:hypothetical protein, partial [Sodalis sp. (in: enterobacteria)]|uniref:hypothetical protein n=1 Tax=Sodalis sp. (in: enterobacteria) TaxID=1898979 RepID=UPI003F41AB38
TEVELATLDWVDWYNNRRLLGRLGYIPPTEAEMNYYASQLAFRGSGVVLPKLLSNKLGVIQPGGQRFTGRSGLGRRVIGAAAHEK